MIFGGNVEIDLEDLEDVELENPADKPKSKSAPSAIASTSSLPSVTVPTSTEGVQPPVKPLPKAELPKAELPKEAAASAASSPPEKPAGTRLTRLTREEKKVLELKLTRSFMEVRFWDNPKDLSRLRGLSLRKLLELRGELGATTFRTKKFLGWKREALVALDNEVQRQADEANAEKQVAIDNAANMSSKGKVADPGFVARAAEKTEPQELPSNKRISRRFSGLSLALWIGVILILLGMLAMSVCQQTVQEARSSDATSQGTAVPHEASHELLTMNGSVEPHNQDAPVSYEEVRHPPGTAGRPNCQRYSLARPGARIFSQADWRHVQTAVGERTPHWACAHHPRENEDGSRAICDCDWITYRQR
ncbi:hypothetical protein COX00_00350 [Candidatus Uhrbacteria bacterium CG22_combo_CG10-13_8_21_14_all_47_17]|uniref:Uncharacterized protein n=1 Tax=Candidatus Uhrbacteria bacterium CG22_combo_CG10-13_8_21_14_all_47_17 TaxID=1975041 RepID=A0A2H0BVA5_9BACT|nr:MAG: hypothetical protein COX00_00350 [Candidatus Uhrbacteria bacterium CG22_combo_CG10-13_8_21_14_all_47_17]